MKTSESSPTPDKVWTLRLQCLVVDRVPHPLRAEQFDLLVHSQPPLHFLAELRVH